MDEHEDDKDAFLLEDNAHLEDKFYNNDHGTLSFAGNFLRLFNLHQ